MSHTIHFPDVGEVTPLALAFAEMMFAHAAFERQVGELQADVTKEPGFGELRKNQWSANLVMAKCRFGRIFLSPGSVNPRLGEGTTTQCRYGRSGDRESPFGSAHFKVRAFDWDSIRAEH
jgi:hypothetical protein